MRIGDYTGKIVAYQEYEPFIRRIRNKVFVEEQGVSESLEMDGLDQDCQHVLVFDSNENAIATARIQKDGHIGRMAVLLKHRRKRIAKRMLQMLIDLARTDGIETVYVNAQLYAVPFYEQAGFKQVSAVFYEASMPHVTMEKILIIH